MNPSAILAGTDTTHQAMGFARSTALRLTGFLVTIGVFQGQKSDTPLFDKSIADAMGDNGLAQATVIDLNTVTEAHAAAFILLNRHIAKPDPDTGRKPEFMIDAFLKKGQPSVLLANAVESQIKRDLTRMQANAAMVGADPTKRAAALRAEFNETVALHVGPVTQQFVSCLGTFKDADDESLIDVVVEAIKDAGRDLAGELKQSALMSIDSARKRIEGGKYATIDAGVYKLAGLENPAAALAAVNRAYGSVPSCTDRGSSSFEVSCCSNPTGLPLARVVGLFFYSSLRYTSTTVINQRRRARAHGPINF
jgi:hypothetical protein